VVDNALESIPRRGTWAEKEAGTLGASLKKVMLSRKSTQLLKVPDTRSAMALSLIGNSDWLSPNF